MPRSFRWMVGLLALTLTPGLVLAQAAAPQTHTVREGDTLWDLAKHYRGDPFLWPDIYRMNTERRRGSALDLSRRSAPARRRRQRPGRAGHGHAQRRCRAPADTTPADSLTGRQRAGRSRARRWAADEPTTCPPADARAAHPVSANEPGEERAGSSGPSASNCWRRASRPTRISRTGPSGGASSTLRASSPRREAAVRHGAGPRDAPAGACEQRQRQRDAVLDHRGRGTPRRHLPGRRYPARGDPGPEFEPYGEVVMPTGLVRS